MTETKGFPTMMSIREVANTGIMPEHALRLLFKQGKLPCVMVGTKALVNFDKLVEQLNSL